MELNLAHMLHVFSIHAKCFSFFVLSVGSVVDQLSFRGFYIAEVCIQTKLVRFKYSLGEKIMLDITGNFVNNKILPFIFVFDSWFLIGFCFLRFVVVEASFLFSQS